LVSHLNILILNNIFKLLFLNKQVVYFKKFQIRHNLAQYHYTFLDFKFNFNDLNLINILNFILELNYFNLQLNYLNFIIIIHLCLTNLNYFILL
jgi:hypothetical protein